MQDPVSTICWIEKQKKLYYIVRLGNSDNVSQNSCRVINPYFMKMMRPPDVGPDDLPVTGFFSGMLMSSVWYWCADQVIVQRILSAKNISHAKAGCVLAAFLKLLPLFLFILPGMAARVLFPDQVIL